MEDFALEIAKEVAKEVMVKITVNVIKSSAHEWEEGWKRDYEAGGFSYQEPEEETAFEGA